MSVNPELSGSHHAHLPESVAHTSLRQRLVGVGLAGVVSVGIAAPASEAHMPINNSYQAASNDVSKFDRKEEKKAELSLKRKIQQNKQLNVYDGSVKWSEYSEDGSLEMKYRTKYPIVQKIKQKNGKMATRYFDVMSGLEDKEQILVSVLPVNAEKEAPKNKRRNSGKVGKYAVRLLRNKEPMVQKPSTLNKRKIQSYSLGSTDRIGSKMHDVMPSGDRYVELMETTKSLREAKTVQDFSRVLQGFMDQYGVKVNILSEDVGQKIPGYFSGHLRDSDMGVIKNFTIMFVKEFSKYPPDFIASLGIKSVSIVNQLIQDGYSPRGLANVNDGSLVYSLNNIAEMQGAINIVHHEVGHFAGYQLFNWYKDDNQVWHSLNPLGYQYKGGMGFCRLNDLVCQSTLGNQQPARGFITQYSETNIKEDHAELFALIMCSSLNDIKKITAADPILAQKIQYFKQLIGQSYTFFNDKYLAGINPATSC